jgi:hypothetical protein
VLVINGKLKKICLILNTLCKIARDMSEYVVSLLRLGVGSPKMRRILQASASHTASFSGGLRSDFPSGGLIN